MIQGKWRPNRKIFFSETCPILPSSKLRANSFLALLSYTTIPFPPFPTLSRGYRVRKRTQHFPAQVLELFPFLPLFLKHPLPLLHLLLPSL